MLHTGREDQTTGGLWWQAQAPTDYPSRAESSTTALCILAASEVNRMETKSLQLVIEANWGSTIPDATCLSSHEILVMRNRVVH